MPILPIFCWLIFLWLGWPSLVFGQWECLLVLFSALNIVPPALDLLGVKNPVTAFFSKKWTAEAVCLPGLLLGLAFQYQSQSWAAVCAGGYAIWALVALFDHLAKLLSLVLARAEAAPKFHLQHLLPVFALGYLATGALFAFFYVLDFQPLGFESLVVSLTAAHFHVAGFALTTLIFALWRRQIQTRVPEMLGWAALLGMPAVAAGIVVTKLGFSPMLENITAPLFALMAFSVAFLQIKDAFSPVFSLQKRALWAISAICLLAGAFLAMLYGLRFQIPLAWVTIPNLKIWHGTLNTLGFAYLGVWAAKIPSPLNAH